MSYKQHTTTSTDSLTQPHINDPKPRFPDREVRHTSSIICTADQSDLKILVCQPKVVTKAFADKKQKYLGSLSYTFMIMGVRVVIMQ